ncbi:MAG: hypothetical protein H0W92_01530 [Sphingomonas sp.]|nr:hypothetical protein [Sphingomonas sp.]
MRAFARNSLLAASLELFAVSAASAQQGIYLPSAPQGPGGEDTIETASGTRCRQSINSNSGYFDFGLAGSGGAGIPQSSGAFITINERDREALAYARVTLPLGKQPKRIDCSRVFEIEIERLREEVALLRMNAQ